MRRLLGALVMCVGLSGCVFYLNPQCNDQISNGSETDVDCGGSCNACEAGQRCHGDADCIDSTCVAGTCTPLPCFNDRQDGDETDVDCGGGTCRTCAGGRACSANTDCASGTCEASGTCAGLRAVAFDRSVVDAAGEKPYALFCADLDGDGDLDLASADELSSNLVVLRNDGAGGFPEVIVPDDPPLTTSHVVLEQYLVNPDDINQYPTGGAVADLNGDGVPDVITANFHGDSVSVMLNPGTGVFGATASFGTVAAGETSNLALGDLDGDGKLDVIATNQSKASVSVFLSQGDGTLRPSVTIPVGITGAAEPFSAAIADFDGDGHADVAIGDQLTSTVIVRLGNGNGTFQPEVAYSLRGQGAPVILALDINGDGKPDLISANRDSNNISVLLGRGDGTFRKAITSSTGTDSGPYAIAIADFNNDGVPDVVTGDFFITKANTFNTASVLIGIGNGKFEPPVVVPGFASYGVAVGDFDGDGKVDFATANFADHSVTIKLNTSQ
jgi:FG-GAP-like repeat